MRASGVLATWAVAAVAWAGVGNPAPGNRHSVALVCPTAVPGTRVRAEETARGAALVFTTTGDVDELRHRVEVMAGQMNEHSGEAQGIGGAGVNEPPLPGAHGAGEHAMGEHPPMPASEVHVDAIQGGARLDFIPHDPLQLPALRDDVRAHAEDMAHGHCPILRMHADER